MKNNSARVKSATEISIEEAPIGYVQEDLESRFITANRAAMRILGLKPDEVVGTVGMSLVADTAENKQRVREAFASIGQGTGQAAS